MRKIFLVPIIVGGIVGGTIAGAAARHTPTTTTVPQAAICHAVGGLQDRACTPGAGNPNVTQANISSTICVRGWTATVRPPVSVTNKIKTERMRAYGFTGLKSLYELDHLVPLELGGAPASVQNLWPEAYAGSLGARVKDRTENRLRAEVCAGTIPLATAQLEIAADWQTAR